MTRKRPSYLEKEPPHWTEAKRLVPYARTPSGSVKHWQDPVTQKVYTQYQKQTAMNGYLRPAEAAAARKALGKDEYNRIRDAAHMDFTNVANLASGWARTHHVDKSKALRSADFWRDVEDKAYPLQAAGRVGTAARKWAEESAFVDPDRSYDDPHFLAHIFERYGPQGTGEYSHDLIRELFDDYPNLEDEFFDAFGIDIRDLFDTGGDET